MLASLYQYRRFILQHAVADLRNRYAGTGMGVVWNVLHPLALIAIYSLVFSTIMPIRLPGLGGRLSYVLYLCSGLFPWIAFSDCIARGCTSFVANAGYLKKLPIPEQIFVAQGTVATAMSLALNFATLLVLAAAVGLPARATWLLLPLPLLALLALGFGIGLLLGTLNVFFRDISELTGIALQLLMWTAPVIYVADVLPTWAQAIVAWHPVVPALSAIRQLFLDGQLPPSVTWLTMIGWAILSVLIGLTALRLLRREIRDVI